jgi:hypothetical protein
MAQELFIAPDLMFHYLKALYTMPAGLQLVTLARHSTILAVAKTTMCLQTPPMYPSKSVAVVEVMPPPAPAVAAEAEAVAA